MTAHDPAFPLHALGTTATGLTKRELFAAMAMQGLLASETGSFAYMRAAAAVELADALIAALDTE